MISNEDKKALADNYFEDGKKFKVEGKYREALKAFQKAYKIHEKINAVNSAGDLFEIAECQKEIGNLEMADKAFYKADLAFVSAGCNNEDLATCLIGHANLCRDIGNYPDAESLHKRALSIYEKALGPDHPDVARTLNGIAILKRITGQYAVAEPLYQRALSIYEKAFGPDYHEVATTLGNIATLKDTTGQYAEAEQLYQRALSIQEKALGPDHPDVATTLNNIAALKYATGQYADAEPLYQRALSIYEKELGSYHPDVAMTLNNIAALKYATGQYADAEPSYQRALSIQEKAFGLDHLGVATTLNNIAELKRETGQYADAELLYQRSLSIQKKVLGPDHPNVARTLNGIAILKRVTGQYAKAEQLYQGALSIQEKALGPDHPEVATTLGNIATLKDTTGQYAEAEQLYQRALSIQEKALGPDHPDVAIILDHIAILKHETGQYAEAELLYQRAISIYEKAFGADHPDIAHPLCFLAALRNNKPLAKGKTFFWIEKKNILCLYNKALHISQSASDPQLLWIVLYEYSKFYSQENKNGMAIFFGKQAVNVIQGIRTNVHLMGDEIESLYTATVEEVFKHLADLLIVDGRFLEAEQVINLLKQHEYFEFIRRDAAYASELSGTVTFTELETQIDTRLAKKSITLAAFAKERTYLRNKKNRSINDEERLTTLDEKIEKANKAYQHTISKICKELEKTKHGDRTASIRSANSLQQDLKEVGHDAVAIYTVAGEKEFRTILITPTFRKAFSYPIGEKELRKKIFQFRRALLMGDGKLYDPIDLAKELYDIIIGPMAGELRDHEAKTLMWSLDGNLRYIPIAALYDGEKYLVETYRNIMFTPSTLARMKDNPKKDWEGFGLGVTEKYEKFHSLPYVREELANIIRSGDSPVGVMNGMICLDQAFTFDSLRNGISAHGYPLVHIASHFQLNPCNDTMSFLLLGDGTHLTLDKIKVQDALFGGVDLLTLSACNTAVGNDRQDGREVECFGLLAENQGAKAILATLWPVEDSSTSLLMQEFYRQHAKGKSKAEALRQAQIALLTGNIKPTIPPTWSKRKNKSKKDNGDPPEYRYEPDPQKPFAHPYFWAPFILIGNWK